MSDGTMTAEVARETFDALTETQRSVYLAIEANEGSTKETLATTFKPQVVGSAVKGLTTKGLIVEADGVFAPAFDARFGDGEGEAFEPVVIRARRARSSGVMVAFWKLGPHQYKCVCEHGTEHFGTERYPVARAAASPEAWCEECAKEAKARLEAKAAKKAERAKAKAAKAKKDSPKDTKAKAKAKDA